MPTLQQFQQLKTLHFELNLVSDSLPWILEVIWSWSSAKKAHFHLIIYENQPYQSTAETIYRLSTYNHHLELWANCDSWNTWWDRLTDSLLDALAPNLTNHGTCFTGDFFITFVMQQKPKELEQQGPGSQVWYANRLLRSYKGRALHYFQMDIVVKIDFLLLTSTEIRGERFDCRLSQNCSINQYDILNVFILSMHP